MVDYNGGRTLDDFVKFLEPEAAEVNFIFIKKLKESFFDYLR